MNKNLSRGDTVDNNSRSVVNQILADIESQKIAAEWDFSSRQTTLGGALTFRCELEMLARLSGKEHVYVNYLNLEQDKKYEKLITGALKASKIDFKISRLNTKGATYPKTLMTSLGDYSFFSTSRITYINSIYNSQPILKWKDDFDSALKIKEIIDGEDYAVIHLKNIGSYEESRADMRTWIPLISEISSSTSLLLLLLGDDEYPEELLQIKRIIHLKKYSIPLMTQLSFASRAQFFVGSASGMATTAIYSDVPYMIFKNPMHHVSEMKQEIKDANRFPWAGNNQFILRENPSMSHIQHFISELSTR